jgi:hypothetical protein
MLVAPEQQQQHGEQGQQAAHQVGGCRSQQIPEQHGLQIDADAEEGNQQHPQPQKARQHRVQHGFIAGLARA